MGGNKGFYHDKSGGGGKASYKGGFDSSKGKGDINNKSPHKGGGKDNSSSNTGGGGGKPSLGRGSGKFGAFEAESDYYKNPSAHSAAASTNESNQNIFQKGGPCRFYSKVGACRHGASCSRQHIKLERSRTLLLAHVFIETTETHKLSSDPISENDPDGGIMGVSDEQYRIATQTIEEFYEECFHKLAQYGELEDLLLVDNISDHLCGNVYVKYYHEDSAVRAYNALEDGWYNGRKLKIEYSPVLEFRDARCRAFSEGKCNRGQDCNFLHLRHVPKALKRSCANQMYHDHPDYIRRREEEGRPLVYKNMTKIDWNNEQDAREDFKTSWWSAYEIRRKAEREGRIIPGFTPGGIISNITQCLPIESSPESTTKRRKRTYNRDDGPTTRRANENYGNGGNGNGSSSQHSKPHFNNNNTFD